MDNIELIKCELNLIRDGLETREDVTTFLGAGEHDKSVMSQLHDTYLYTPTIYCDVYVGCWESKEEFATDLASETGILDSDWSTYFDYDMWTNDLFMSDYTSSDCEYCGDLIIVRYD